MRTRLSHNIYINLAFLAGSFHSRNRAKDFLPYNRKRLLVIKLGIVFRGKRKNCIGIFCNWLWIMSQFRFFLKVFRFKYEALMLVCLILIESRKLKSLVPNQNQISRQVTNDFVFLGMQSSYLSKCANCILSCCALYLLLNKVIPIFASTEPSQLVRAPIEADALWYVWSRIYANKCNHSLKRNLNNNLEQDWFQFWWTAANNSTFKDLVDSQFNVQHYVEYLWSERTNIIFALINHQNDVVRYVNEIIIAVAVAGKARRRRKCCLLKY